MDNNKIIDDMIKDYIEDKEYLLKSIGDEIHDIFYVSGMMDDFWEDKRYKNALQYVECLNDHIQTIKELKSELDCIEARIDTIRWLKIKTEF